LPTFWLTKSLVCIDVFIRDSTIQSDVRRFRFLVSRPDDVSSRQDAHLSTIPSVRMTSHTVRTPDRPSIIRPDNVPYRPDLHCFEKLLFQLASVRTFQQPVRTPLSYQSTSDSFQVQFKGRLLQPFGRRGFPSERAPSVFGDTEMMAPFNNLDAWGDI
jgi:hypothetical protein